MTAKMTIDDLPEPYRTEALAAQREAQDILTTLSPVTRQQIDTIIVKFSNRMRPQPGTDDVKDLIKAFHIALKDIPAIAVAGAFHDFNAGNVQNHTGQYIPTPAEFAKHARSIAAPLHNKIRALKSRVWLLLAQAERRALNLERQAERMARIEQVKTSPAFKLFKQRLLEAPAGRRVKSPRQALLEAPKDFGKLKTKLRERNNRIASRPRIPIPKIEG